MGYDIGGYKRAEAIRNRTAVYRMLMENPGITRKEIAQALGLRQKAVGDHVRLIRDGWRPESE